MALPALNPVWRFLEGRLHTHCYRLLLLNPFLAVADRLVSREQAVLEAPALRVGQFSACAAVYT